MIHRAFFLSLDKIGSAIADFKSKKGAPKSTESMEFKDTF